MEAGAPGLHDCMLRASTTAACAKSKQRPWRPWWQHWSLWLSKMWRRRRPRCDWGLTVMLYKFAQQMFTL
eukprot:COSAG03_NODE_2032_length_3201_cov_3.153127_2_plen_70_part_00